jgi:hypothetical protein
MLNTSRDGHNCRHRKPTTTGHYRIIDGIQDCIKILIIELTTLLFVIVSHANRNHHFCQCQIRACFNRSKLIYIGFKCRNLMAQNVVQIRSWPIACES